MAAHISTSIRGTKEAGVSLKATHTHQKEEDIRNKPMGWVDQSEWSEWHEWHDLTK
jgi:hypothetical protein